MKTIKCRICGKEIDAAHGKYCSDCRKIIKRELDAKRQRKGGLK